MIAEIRFKNMFSFRDEAILSFEADRSKDMESYHVVELGGDVRLLKVAVIYGANASGKSNIIKVCDFIKSFITYTPLNKAEQIQIVPFLLNKTNSRQLSEYSISFYLKNEEKAVRYVYSVALDRWHVAKESLIYYPSQQPATIFERNTENNVSVIKFGQKIKMSQAVKEEITLKCSHALSIFEPASISLTHLSFSRYFRVLSYVGRYCFNALSVAAESWKCRHVSSKCSKNQYSIDCKLSQRITLALFSYFFLSDTIFLFSASERLLTSASKTHITKTSSSRSSFIFFSIFSILLFSNKRGEIEYL